MAELAGQTEAPPSLDSIHRTNMGALSGLVTLKEELEDIVNGDGSHDTMCDDKEKEIDPVPTMIIIQKQADRIKILTDEINFLVTTLRGKKHDFK